MLEARREYTSLYCTKKKKKIWRGEEEMNDEGWIKEVQARSERRDRRRWGLSRGAEGSFWVATHVIWQFARRTRTHLWGQSARSVRLRLCSRWWCHLERARNTSRVISAVPTTSPIALNYTYTAHKRERERKRRMWIITSTKGFMWCVHPSS